MTSQVRFAHALVYLFAFGSGLVGALVTTPLARRIAVRLDIVDRPSERKPHGEKMPYLGGLSLVIAFVFPITGGFVVHALRGGGGSRKFLAILAGALILAAVGLLDDIRPVSGWIKALVIVPLAVGLYAMGVRADPFTEWGPNFLLTIGWVAGIVNATNFLDNTDGLTAGVSAVAAGYFSVLAVLSGQLGVAALAASIAGCALGFLWFNRAPARIFMGDMGSMFLGWLLASLALELEFQNLKRVAFFVPIGVLAVPIFDTLLVTVSRSVRGVSPLRPGLDHTSHRLKALGLSHSVVIALHYFAALACGWLAVTIALARPKTAYMVMGLLVASGLFLGALLSRVNPDERR